jgi:uncharacterized protein
MSDFNQDFKSPNQILIVLTHLSAIFPFFGPFLIALVVMLVSNPNTDLRLAGRQSLGFQLTMVVLYIICAISIIGIPLLLVLPIIHFIMPIVAGVQSSDNSKYKYPRIFNFILP